MRMALDDVRQYALIADAPPPMDRTALSHFVAVRPRHGGISISIMIAIEP